MNYQLIIITRYLEMVFENIDKVFCMIFSFNIFLYTHHAFLFEKGLCRKHPNAI